MQEAISKKIFVNNNNFTVPLLTAPQQHEISLKTFNKITPFGNC